MNVGEIHHVVLSVADLDRSVAFYEQGLGLRRTLEMEVGGPDTERMLGLPAGMTGRSVYLQGPSQVGQVELVQWDPPRPDPSGPKRPGDPGVFVLSFPVPRDDLEPLFEHLRAHGHQCLGPPETTVLDNYGPITAFIALDPDGTMIELISLPTAEEVRAFRARVREHRES